MKRYTFYADCAVLLTALLFSMIGCMPKETADEPSLPVFAPVETEQPAKASDPLALVLPHDTILYDVPPLPASYAIEPFGTITDTAHRIGFFADGTLRETVTVNGSMQYYLLRTDGSRITDTPYLGISALSDTVFAVTADRSTVNRIGLVRADGTVLVPCEAAAIVPLTDNADKMMTPRFAAVIIAEDRTDNTAEAFFERDGVLYTGYALLYDLERCRYVPNLRLTNRASHLPAASDRCIAVSNIASGSTVLYTPDGSPAASYSKLDEIVLGRDAYLARSGSESRIFEYDGTATYVTDKPITYIEGEGRYFAEQGTDGTAILDRFGNRLFDETFDRAEEEYGGVFHAVKSDGTHVLTDLSGKHLYETADEVPHHLSHGIYECGKTVILPDGSMFEAAAGDGSHLFFLNDTSNAYCFADRDFSLTLPSDEVYAVSDALIAVRDGDEYVLFDLYAGREKSRGGYGVIASAYGYLYARCGGNVDVLRIRTADLTEDDQTLQNVNTK